MNGDTEENSKLMQGLGRFLMGVGGTGLWKHWWVSFNWSLAIYIKGHHQHWIFLENRPFASERVPGFKFHYVLVLWLCGEWGWGVEGDFGSEFSWRSKFSSLYMLQLHDLQFGLCL